MRFLGAILYMSNRTFKRIFCRKKTKKLQAKGAVPIKHAKVRRKSGEQRLDDGSKGQSAVRGGELTAGSGSQETASSGGVEAEASHAEAGASHAEEVAVTLSSPKA